MHRLVPTRRNAPRATRRAVGCATVIAWQLCSAVRRTVRVQYNFACENPFAYHRRRRRIGHGLIERLSLQSRRAIVTLDLAGRSVDGPAGTARSPARSDRPLLERCWPNIS